MAKKRNRIVYAILLIMVMILGILSRKFAAYLPSFINTYLGDALWAAMVYFAFAWIFIRHKPLRISLYALLFSFTIELSQLYHAPWIDSIRNTTLGALVLGFGFLWSDILAYCIGVLFGFMVDFLMQKDKFQNKRLFNR